MSVYKVTGRTAYRGHQPGATFEATLEQRAEARALTRGSIEIVEHSTPALKPGSYTLPRKDRT